MSKGSDKLAYTFSCMMLLASVLFAYSRDIYEFYDEQIDTRSDCWKIYSIYSASCYSKRFKHQIRGVAIDFIQNDGDVDVILHPPLEGIACVRPKTLNDASCLVEIELDRQAHRIPFQPYLIQLNAYGLPESFGRALEQAERIKVTLITSEGERKTYKFSVKKPLKDTEGWQSW